MKIMNIFVSVVISFLYFYCLCFTSEAEMISKENKEYLFKGGKIYYHGKLFAELRYFRDDICIRGFAIYYYDNNKEIWINPAQGWQVENFVTGEKVSGISEIEKFWNSGDRNLRLLLGGKVPSKEDFISSCSFDISVSEDGTVIAYKTRGLLFTSTHKYLIRKQVDRGVNP